MLNIKYYYIEQNMKMKQEVRKSMQLMRWSEKFPLYYMGLNYPV